MHSKWICNVIAGFSLAVCVFAGAVPAKLMADDVFESQTSEKQRWTDSSF